MSNSCRHICLYYEIDSSFRNSQSTIFKKQCHKCEKIIISKYHKCPCCHDSLDGDVP